MVVAVVGQLDHHRGLLDVRGGRLAQLGAQHHEQRPEPLPAGEDDVLRGVGDQLG